jgi:arylsulfatase A-like enzyme
MATRRDFLKTTAGAVVAGTLASGCGSDGESLTSSGGNPTPLLPNGRRPNILLLLVDEMRLPPEGFTAGQGEIPDLKEIFGFSTTLSANNQMASLLPGFTRLRKNALVLRKHYIAAAACSPSRTTFLTGQYPSLHGVTQVTGTFSAPHEVKYLDPVGVPTVGDWFRAADYETYYMGKWHVSDTSAETGVDSLEPWGFSYYRPFWPEPNSTTDNLATYRDPGFAEDMNAFLRQKGATRGTGKPWFAVASFVNPHDTGAYPVPFFGPDGPNPNDPNSGDITSPTDGTSVFLSGGLNPRTNGAFPTPRPAQLPPPTGKKSYPNVRGIVIDLNPGGFPQQTFNLPPTYDEDLTTKPDCHFDSSVKMQLALAAPLPLTGPLSQYDQVPYPLQVIPTLADREAWAKTSGSFYTYLQYLVDIEMNKILTTFDQVGLAEDTIIVFTSDHGSLGMSHGLMLQKFFNAYEEALRVPFVISSPLINPTNQIQEYRQTTSHIDLVPSLLGLAGYTDQGISELKTRITGHSQTRDLVGLNLVPRIFSNADLSGERPGVLFTTSDDPTRLPPGELTPFYGPNYNDNYKPRVEDTAKNYLSGRIKDPTVDGTYNTVEPNSVHAICTGIWKYVRYIDEDNPVPKPDQFEFYHLPSDPIEATNLVDFKTGALRNGVAVPGLTTPQLQAQLDLLKTQLAEQESRVLLTP